MGQVKRQLVLWGAIATTTAVLPGLALADLASPGQGGGRHGRGDHRHGGHHRHDDARLSVVGRALSKGTTDSYGLQIRGRSGDEPTDAGGMVRFAHRGENGMEGLVGKITCLSKDPAGVVSVTGTIVRSGKRDKANKSAPDPAEDSAFLEDLLRPDESGQAAPVHGRDGEGDRRGRRGDRRQDQRGGGELAGKDFALTISVAGRPQKFSQPAVAERGTLAACSGGGVPTADVTRGGFRVREAGAENAGDARDGGGGEDRDGRRGRRGWWR